MNFPQNFIELEVAAGVEELALAELYQYLHARIEKTILSREPGSGVIQLVNHDALESFSALRSVNSVFLGLRFAIPRPKALLGDEHFRRLMGSIKTVISRADRDQFNTLYLSAAGRDSKVLVRLKNEIARASELEIGSEDGDLLVRLRRPLDDSPGWEVLIRTSPRPLSTRAWRVCNYPGALNASVAQALVILSEPRTTDTVLNLGCGSGTLMVERLGWGLAQKVVGCDLSEEALDCSRKNLAAAGVAKMTEILRSDGRELPFFDQSFDVFYSDLPFGSLVGSHAENLNLYPALLNEAARVIRRGGRFVLITHEIRLMEKLLANKPVWRLEREVKVTLRGLHPRIYLLKRL